MQTPWIETNRRAIKACWTSEDNRSSCGLHDSDKPFKARLLKKEGFKLSVIFKYEFPFQIQEDPKKREKLKFEDTPTILLMEDTSRRVHSITIKMNNPNFVPSFSLFQNFVNSGSKKLLPKFSSTPRDHCTVMAALNAIDQLIAKEKRTMNEFHTVRDETNRVASFKNPECFLSIKDASVKAIDLDLSINGHYEIAGIPLTSLEFTCSNRYWSVLVVSSCFVFGKLSNNFDFTTKENMARWRIVSVSENSPHTYRVSCKLDGQGKLSS